MPLMSWNDDYLIGIESLDYEHRDLFDHINALHENRVRNAATVRIEDYLGDILKRMTAHFAHEEYLMHDGDYDHFVAHKKEHEAFLDDYIELMKEYLAHPSDEKVRAIEGELIGWIVDHVMTTDKQMASMS